MFEKCHQKNKKIKNDLNVFPTPDSAVFPLWLLSSLCQPGPQAMASYVSSAFPSQVSFSQQHCTHSKIYSFNLQIFIEHLLSTKPCSRHWEHSSEQVLTLWYFHSRKRERWGWGPKKSDNQDCNTGIKIAQLVDRIDPELKNKPMLLWFIKFLTRAPRPFSGKRQSLQQVVLGLLDNHPHVEE